MKDTILYELEYDEHGNPDIRVTMDMARKGRLVFRLEKIKQPNFEDLPVNMQLEFLNTITVNARKYISELAKEEITSLKNAENRRSFPLDVTKSYALIVNKFKKKNPARFWKEALAECINYSSYNHSREIFEAIKDTTPERFRKMIEYYEENLIT
jgi:hypothetical protein